ncbi:MAG: hypothetical protein GIW98_00550 [Candidatus Eremiobacteraeota bacterium]|nr:hypothetical protein [Candidatus Eremiobacteraeota bacterium]
MMRRSVYAGVIAFVVILATSHLRSTPYNNFVLLADALRHGHTWITWPGAYIDALPYNGRYYVIEAPMPAVLLLPFELIFGMSTNQTLLAVLLGAIAIGAAWRICEQLQVPAKTSIWLCAFMLAGTDLLWCAMLGDVWFIAHVSAVCFTFLAITELLGRKRGWLAALWALCAIESRFTMVVAVPVYFYLLFLVPAEEESASDLRARLLSFGGVLCAGALLWVFYNEARWGTLADIGYTNWYHQDSAGMPTGSPFRLMYFWYEVQSFFVARPDFLRTPPFVVPPISGIALTWTSPALLLAFFAREPRRLAVAMWIAAGLTAAPNFLYYVNGFAQFGMRHALDFVPFLFVLMALGVRAGLPLSGRLLIVYSIAVGLWGCWYWNAVVRTTF